MPEVNLIVNGRSYGGWTSVSVTRGIEAIAGRFSLQVSERWKGQDAPWPIREEDECTVEIDGKTLITGFVDARSHSYDTQDHSLSVAGRDAAAALVDCSAVLDTWEFKATPLDRMVRILCEPFGIPVTLQPGLTIPPPQPKITIDKGDKVFDIIERECKIAGCLPVSPGTGGLLLTRTGTTRATTTLQEGTNILSADASYQASARFRRYIVVGQHAGNDEDNAAAAASVRGEGLDPNVRRADRVLMIQAERGVTRAYAKTRAEWEATVRAAKAERASVRVQGWHQADGTLWPINALVDVFSPWLDIHTERLISEATYTLDDEGWTITDIVLVQPDAFRPEPSVPKTTGRASGGDYSSLLGS